MTIQVQKKAGRVRFNRQQEGFSCTCEKPNWCERVYSIQQDLGCLDTHGALTRT